MKKVAVRRVNEMCIRDRYNTSPKDKLVMDLIYIENYSIWQDLKLIFQTFTVFLKASESTEAFGVEEVFDFDEDREKKRKMCIRDSHTPKPCLIARCCAAEEAGGLKGVSPSPRGWGSRRCTVLSRSV